MQVNHEVVMIKGGLLDSMKSAYPNLSAFEIRGIEFWSKVAEKRSAETLSSIAELQKKSEPAELTPKRRIGF